MESSFSTKPGLLQTDTKSGFGHSCLILEPQENRAEMERHALSDNHMSG